MASEAYRRVGRGGAGNYYSAQDIKNIEENSKDVEAQNPNASFDPIHIDRRPPEYAHQGRGGAGNWCSPAEAPAPDSQVSDPADVSEASMSKPSYSGRGGAGNYNPGNDETRQMTIAKKAEDRQRSLEGEVLQDVEQELRAPEKAHLGEGRLLLRDMH